MNLPGSGMRNPFESILVVRRRAIPSLRSAAVMTLLLSLCLVCDAPADEAWKVLKGEHFLIYYVSDAAWAGQILTKAEHYYDKIASDLGYLRYDNFWQWDNRARIYIYDTREDFLMGSGATEWARGMTRYDTKEIMVFKGIDGFMDTLLPHELTHLVFRDFVGFKGEVPLWLDEGVAQWEEAQRKVRALERVRELVREGTFIPIDSMMQMEIRTEKDTETVKKFYSQAISLVGFLVEKYGASKFTFFCRQLRDGKDVNSALSSAYMGSIRNTGELQEEWLEYYGEGGE